MVPPLNWADVSKPGEGTQYGCPYCLMKGEKAPIDVVYMWAGTAVCHEHLKTLLPKEWLDATNTSVA